MSLFSSATRGGGPSTTASAKEKPVSRSMTRLRIPMPPDVCLFFFSLPWANGGLGCVVFLTRVGEAGAGRERCTTPHQEIPPRSVASAHNPTEDEWRPENNSSQGRKYRDQRVRRTRHLVVDDGDVHVAHPCGCRVGSIMFLP